ncbi:hypothetical protein ACQKJC_08730 [Priestia koreensis]|uniref:hypothetical protein n=1 Tax=Priestia koreensis TaxID=284581 RepID=UPI003CFD6B3C
MKEPKVKSRKLVPNSEKYKVKIDGDIYSVEEIETGHRFFCPKTKYGYEVEMYTSNDLVKNEEARRAIQDMFDSY